MLPYLLSIALWLPPQYILDAENYYAQCDSAQWVDIVWHYDNYGLLNAARAGMEGSNRPRGQHGDEDSHQDVGININTARLYYDFPTLRDSLKVHAFAANLSAIIDADNLKRFKKKKRPLFCALNAYKWGYPKGKDTIYGMATAGRLIVLHRRLNAR